MTTGVTFAGLSLQLPPGWCDITSDLAEGSPPTLARGANGVGALQFSVAHYRSGPVPGLELPELIEMLEGLAQSEAMASRGNRRTRQTPLPCVWEDFDHLGDFVRLYYTSDGENVAMITYRCQLSDALTGEPAEADEIVLSVRFS